MNKLGTRELGQLKSLLSGEALPTESQTSILNILRSELPDFLSQLTPDLTEEDRKDNSKVINYLAKNKNKSKILLGKKLYLSSPQQIELIAELEKPAATTGASGQQEGQPAGQETQPAGATSSSGGIPSMPAAPSISTPYIRPVYQTKPPVPEAPKPDIAIANKSGVVAEKPPSEFHIADKSGNITATYTKEPIPAKGPGTEAPQSKLVSARGDGSIIEQVKPTSKIAISDSRGNVIKEHTLPTQGKFNFSAFRTQVQKGVAGAARAGLEKANPLLKRGGNALVKGLTNIANPGGMEGIGGGSRSVLGKIGRFGRGASRGGASAVRKAGANWGKRALILLILGFALLGGVAISGTPPNGEAAIIPPIPPITPSDISSCKFTRAGANAQFQSPLLLSYIQEAAQKANIPPVILAAFIRVESPSSSGMVDEQITSYAANCAESPTKALGIMQIQPPGTTSLRGDPASCDDCIDAGAKLVGKTVGTMTRADYCDPRTSIIVGGGWILKKMSKLSYGDGTKWDLSWTNNADAIKALVNTYYGCLNYGGAADCTGPYNYASDVSTSIQNCKAPAPSTNPPPTKEFALSCPINNEYNTCSDFFDSRDQCHCAPGFISQSDCIKYPTLKYGIDVGTKTSQTVVIPYITYQGETTPQSMACQLSQVEGATCPASGCENQQILHFHCSTSKGTPDLYLQYNHIKANPNYEKSIGTVLVSGQSIGDVAYYQTGLRRLNIQLGVGGDCSGTNTGTCKRGGDYFQCPLKKDFNSD